MPTIKQEMESIDRRQFNWYSSLSEEDQKKLSMWVLMRYASSVDSKVSEIEHHYLTLTNDIVNVHFNVLRHHPEFQHRLMQIVGIGSTQFHPWIKPPKRKKAKTGNAKLTSFFETLYPHLKDDEIAMMIDGYTKQELEDILEEAGVPKKEVKQYFK